jgi:hypothetical protein
VNAARVITTVAGAGVGVFAGDGLPATGAQFNGPRGAAVDSADNLYLTDSGNTRIRRLNLATAVEVAPGKLNVRKPTGKWVTAYVRFPARCDASHVNLDSVMLQAIDGTDGAVRHSLSNEELLIGSAPGSPKAVTDTDSDAVPDELMVKFDLSTVASWTRGEGGMALRVEGQFQPPVGGQVGEYFSGDALIRLR